LEKINKWPYKFEAKQTGGETMHKYWLRRDDENGTHHMMAATVDRLVSGQKVHDAYGDEWVVDFEIPDGME